MNTQELAATAQRIVGPRKGVLAADESSPTLGKRFDTIGVENTEENARAYREMLFTAEAAAPYIGGVIMFDQTIRQGLTDGTRFTEVLSRQGIVPGIKVDAGAKPLAGADDEKVTEGLDGLRERLAEYHGMGARFTKWRAVITIGPDIPSRYCIRTNAHALARYAALSQEQGLVPIVEPEVLMDWENSIERCAEVTDATLDAVFHELALQRVVLEGMLLKPNMVIPGKQCPQQASVDQVAEATVQTLKRRVPAAVPGIVFLSGGQSEIEATAHLNAMNAMGTHPWALSFSYGRALQASGLQAWKGLAENVGAAQKAYAHRAKCNGLARQGEYTDRLESQHVSA